MHLFDRFGKFFKGERLKHTSIVGFCHSQGYVVQVWWSLSVIFIKKIVKIGGRHLTKTYLALYLLTVLSLQFGIPVTLMQPVSLGSLLPVSLLLP